jgi:hypothetical protein
MFQGLLQIPGLLQGGDDVDSGFGPKMIGGSYRSWPFRLR